MNKKEVFEIRKQFSHENCCITRICACYVNGEKEKMLQFKEAFLSLPEEETFKYFELFKKTLSGTPGKNLLPLAFPLQQETQGGTQEFLLRLRNSRLSDEELLDAFYDKVIESYDFAGQYLILLIHAAYDIPGKSSDGAEMFDASDEVYEHILCSICPVVLTKAGLCYNTEHNAIQQRIRDWVVDAPVKGFLFPSFRDRTADIHEVLYYTKKPEELMEAFIDTLLGCPAPLSASEQKETFQALVTDTLGEECNYEIVRNLHEHLNEMAEENAEGEEPLSLSAPEMKRLLQQSGATAEKLDTFEEDFKTAAGEHTSLLASNIIDTRKFDIQTPHVKIQVHPEYADFIETKYIDGRACLVIPVDSHIEVNGMAVSVTASKTSE